MSSGPFTNSFYNSNKTGDIHPIRIQPETLTLQVAGITNTAPAGPAGSPISAQVSQSKRAKGLNARTVTFKFTPTAPTGYKAESPITLPWLAGVGDFDSFKSGDAVSYQGGTGEVVGTTAETAK